MAGGIVDEEEDERRKARVLKAYCGAGATGVVPHTVYDPRCGPCVQRFWDLYHKDDFVQTKSFLIYQATSQGLIADKNITIHDLDEKLREANRKLSVMNSEAMASRARAVDAEGKLADAESKLRSAQAELQKLRDTVKIFSGHSINDNKITISPDEEALMGNSSFHSWYDEWKAGGSKFIGSIRATPKPEPSPLPDWSAMVSDPLGDVQEYLRKHWNNS